MPLTTPCFLSADTIAAGGLISSTKLFPNAHADTQRIRFTIRAGIITYRSDEGTATAGASGIDLPAGTYEWVINQTEALRYRAIAGAGVSIYVEYYK